MARSKSSGRWLKEHFSDPYVKQSKEDGLRSRAAYKLREIQEKQKLIKPGMTVVDLGSAPGSWSQELSRHLGGKGKIFALDILEQAPIPGVTFMQADFTDVAAVRVFQDQLSSSQVDWVLSDISPNKTGSSLADQLQAMGIAEQVLEFSLKVLSNNGGLLVKVFQGKEFDEYVKMLRSAFKTVKTLKPDASRSRSNEVYLLARGRKLSV